LVGIREAILSPRQAFTEKNMKRPLGSLPFFRLCISSACLFVVLASVPAHADSIAAFSFTSANFRTDDSDTAELGFNFTTGDTPITVTALGYINDGFNGTHVVELFDVATQQALPGALVNVTTVGGGGDSMTFTYTDLASPLTLAANTQYQIVSQFFAGEHYFTQAQGFTSQFGLTLDTGVYGDYGAPPASPDFATSTYLPNNPGDFGPNFKVLDPNTPLTPVPELSSIYLVASGLLSFGVSRLRRS
jgi:hypothetical protein